MMIQCLSLYPRFHNPAVRLDSFQQVDGSIAEAVLAFGMLVVVLVETLPKGLAAAVVAVVVVVVAVAVGAVVAGAECCG